MINLHELRLGNYVYGADPTCIMRATIEHLTTWERTPSLACPIKITEEVLLACGFHKGEKWFVHQLYYVYEEPFDICCTRRKEFVYGDPMIGERGVIGFNKRSPNITSLHQLQNIFFALTGKELQYKP